MIETIQRLEPLSQQCAQQQNVHKQSGKKSLTFSQLLDSVKHESACFSTAHETAQSPHLPRLTGDYLSSFDIVNPTAADRAAQPQGAGAVSAACQTGQVHGEKAPCIDKTSELYQQALELESFFVKIMLDSMRSTLAKTSLTGKDSFAGKMYDDMMYEELARTVTKTAGLGLADQIYLQLAPKGSLEVSYKNVN